MLEIPFIPTRDGKLLRPEEIRSLQYAFGEAPTSFDTVNHTTNLENARPFQPGFLLTAPFTISSRGVFGRKSIVPEYRSLHIELALVDGTVVSMNLPVVSDTALNFPIQMDISGKR